jgi:hypothetical protein
MNFLCYFLTPFIHEVYKLTHYAEVFSACIISANKK